MSSACAHPALARGASLGAGYVVVEHLSRTRRYDTYEVWSRERACSCVAKLPRPDRGDDPRVLDALAEEGRLLCALAHPHLVRGYEVAPGPMVVMETLGGEMLDHLLDRRPQGLDAADVAWLGLQVASALHYLHGHGLLHLDVKPGNVVAEDGRAKLIDLSLARPPGTHPPGLGTWCHLAPEQACGGPVGTAADVWGLGTVLYEAATGVRAFGDEEETGTGSAGADESSRTWSTDDQVAAGYPQLADRAAPVAAHRAMPAGLAAAIDACLHPVPARRPTLPALASELVAYAPGARAWDP